MKNMFLRKSVNYTSIDVITELFSASSGFRKTQYSRLNFTNDWPSLVFVFQNIECYLKGFWHCILAWLTANNPLKFLKVEMTWRESKSLCIASLSRESKWAKWIRRTFSLEAKAWFPFYLVIAQFLSLSVNQGRALSLNVMKRNFEIPQEWCFCLPVTMKIRGVVDVATTLPIIVVHWKFAFVRPMRWRVLFSTNSHWGLFIEFQEVQVMGAKCSWCCHYFGRITLDSAMIQVLHWLKCAYSLDMSGRVSPGRNISHSMELHNVASDAPTDCE